MSDEQVVKSAAEMRQIATAWVGRLTTGGVGLLSGPLGAGKTTFVQGVAAALGTDTAVTSPTFTIVGEYEVSGHAFLRRLVHIDLYRLESAQAQVEPAVQEVLANVPEDTLVLVEWAERLGAQTPVGAWQIAFVHGTVDTERSVIFTHDG